MCISFITFITAIEVVTLITLFYLYKVSLQPHKIILFCAGQYFPNQKIRTWEVTMESLT